MIFLMGTKRNEFRYAQFYLIIINVTFSPPQPTTRSRNFHNIHKTQIPALLMTMRFEFLFLFLPTTIKKRKEKVHQTL